MNRTLKRIGVMLVICIGMVSSLRAASFSVEWLPDEDENTWNASGGTFSVAGKLELTEDSRLTGGSFSTIASLYVAEDASFLPVNAPPALGLLLPDVQVISGTEFIEIVSFAQFSPGPPREALQSLLGYTFSFANSALFAVGPSIDAFGTLRFTPAAGVSGSMLVTVVAQDDGGTANGGVDKVTNSFTFIVLPATSNAVPSVAVPLADFAVGEDAPPTLLDLRAAFQDDLTADEGLFFQLRSNTNPALVLATVLPGTGQLRLDFASNQYGSATLTVRAADAYWLHVEETFTVTVLPLNDGPVVTIATPPVVLEDSGPQSLPGFASFSPGPPDEAGQVLVGYTLSSDNNALFSAPPALDNAGLLTFTPATNANGSATVTMVAQDNGGTANGGVDRSTNTFVITVTAVNDAPQVTLVTNSVVVAMSAGLQTVNAFATFSPGPADETGQALLGYTASSSSNQFFSALPALNNSGTLTFTVATGATGSVAVAVVAQDNGGTANGGVDRQTNSFTISAVNTGSSSVQLDAIFNPGSDGDIQSILVQPDGKILIGGAFTNIGGQARNRIARLNADGTVDASFNPNANNRVQSMALQPDGKVVVGGWFTGIGGGFKDYVARLNTNGTLDTSFGFSAGNWVESVSLQTNGQIIIGGHFTTVNGITTRNRVARINANGTLDTGFNPNAGGAVFTTAVQPDGKVLLGGAFEFVRGQPRNYIARVNADGTLDSDFNPNANDTVYCVAVQPDGGVILGGAFTRIGGVTRNGIGRVSTNGVLEAGFNPNVTKPDDAHYVLSSVLQADGRIIIGGYFGRVGGVAASWIVRLNTNGTLDTSFALPADNQVEAIAMQDDGRVLIGGDFANAGGAARNRLARFSNGPPTQSLSVSGTNRVQWLRGGTSPEARDVAFELSTNGGAAWSVLGAGTRMVGGWELTGLSLPAAGQVRGRARVIGGGYNGSAGLVESVAAYPVGILLTNTTLSGGAFQFGFSASSGSSFTVLATTNVALPSASWTVLGPASEVGAGQFQFTDSSATNHAWRFYRVRSP